VNDALFNTNSGCIVVEEYAFFGHNVSLITGTHDINKTGPERMSTVPLTGRDIQIGRGVFVGSNSTVLGPCVVGDNAVVAAGSVVTRDVEPNVVVAGVPAKLLKRLPVG
jgi:acetyltransferase-like isoleucine patch superfamily enzyme